RWRWGLDAADGGWDARGGASGAHDGCCPDAMVATPMLMGASRAEFGARAERPRPPTSLPNQRLATPSPRDPDAAHGPPRSAPTPAAGAEYILTGENIFAVRSRIR